MKRGHRAGPPDTCDIQADGAPTAAINLTKTRAKVVFDVLAGDPQSTAVSGVGDKASYIPSSDTLIVLKGDGMLSIAVFDDGSRSAEARLEVMKQIGSVAAGRIRAPWLPCLLTADTLDR